MVSEARIWGSLAKNRHISSLRIYLLHNPMTTPVYIKLVLGRLRENVRFYSFHVVVHVLFTALLWNTSNPQSPIVNRIYKCTHSIEFQADGGRIHKTLYGRVCPYDSDANSVYGGMSVHHAQGGPPSQL